MKIAFTLVPRLILSTGLLAPLGCDDSSNLAEPIADTTSAVINGFVPSPWAPDNDPRPRAILRGEDSVGSCTGSLIAPSWVLTAAHCSFAAGQTHFTSVRPADFPGNDNPACPGMGVTCITRNVDAVSYSNLTDMTLAHLSQPFTDITPLPVYQGSEPAILNQVASCYGFSGTYTMTSGLFSTGPSQALFGLSSDDPYFISISGSFSQSIAPGDSGGPCILNGSSIISVASNAVREGATGAVRDFLGTPTRVQFTMGDFNSDGRTDYVATTPAGSTFYFSTASNTFTTSTEPGLPLGAVIFTPGDFDGDLKTDLIVTTAAGSTWWYATNTAGTWDKRNTHTDWVFGAVDFTVANFNVGDRRADFIASTPTDSSWYYATATRGVFTNAFSRPELKLQAVDFVPADFDGDGRDDLIVSTSDGSQWLYANEARTWAAAANTNRPDLPIGATAFVAADFDHDFRSDFIVTTPSGSYWYFATPTRNAFDSNLYNRFDLPLGTVRYAPTDFNNDGRADLVIMIGAGSYYYLSTGRGSFDDATIPHRSDLPLGQVQYSVGDFNKDGRKDLIVTTASGSVRSISTGTGLTNPAPNTSLPL